MNMTDHSISKGTTSNLQRTLHVLIAGIFIILGVSCSQKSKEAKQHHDSKDKEVTAKDILGNPDYQAISYGGYRKQSRDAQPTIEQLKEDLRILSAMGVKILRTYNVQLPHASNVLKAIRQLQKDDPGFEMYVMLGAWIDCKNAWTGLPPDHNTESEQNKEEIARAVELANRYPGIVKVLAVGNEAMVRWATSYYVQPSVILKWVNHLQRLKQTGKLSKDLWITSSDDFASWGGGDSDYHTEDLEKLVHAVDYISMHTYPYHNTHYNPEFWYVPEEEDQLPDMKKIDAAMLRAREFAVSQYHAVSDYVKSVGADKPIHIGETGWATISDGHYGPRGSKATDEYKQGLYYTHMRDWSNASGISCFYFEAFDEPWKDAGNPKGSENHFGLFTVNGQAKYPIWDLVDKGLFDGLTRDGNTIIKTYGGDTDALMADVLAPPATPGPPTTD
jgi:exo-beta-1,3-glucanase (GH17 family)